MKKQIGILLSLVLALFSSCREEMPTFRIIAFEDDQTAITNVSYTTVNVQCEIKELESGDLAKEGKVRFEYADYPEYFNGKRITGHYDYVEAKENDYSYRPKEGKYTATISELTPGTTYYYAPSLNNIYGEVKTFTTLGKAAEMYEFLGTYDMHFYDPWDKTAPGYKTWTGVTISKGYTNTSVIFSGMPYHNNHAFGGWDAHTRSIIISNALYSPSDMFTSGGVNYYPIFTPVYYSKSENRAYWQNNLLVSIHLCMREDGVLVLTDRYEANGIGYDCNAFLYLHQNVSTSKYEGNSDVVAEVTMTKTSSSVSAPSRTKTKESFLLNR